MVWNLLALCAVATAMEAEAEAEKYVQESERLWAATCETGESHTIERTCQNVAAVQRILL